MTALIVRSARQRLGDAWLLALVIGAVLVCAIGVWLEQRADRSLAADHALLGVTFGLCFPLVAWLVSGKLLGPSLVSSTANLARLGVNRQHTVLIWAAAFAGLLAMIGGVLGGLTALLGQYRSDLLWLDVRTCVWVGALAGVAYAGLYTLAALWGTRGRAGALLIDWILGSGSGTLALIWPRGHLRSLLGGEAVLGLPQWQSALGLALLAFSYLLLTQVRVPP